MARFPLFSPLRRTLPRRLGPALALVLVSLAGGCSTTSTKAEPVPTPRPASAPSAEAEADAKFQDFVRDFRATALASGVTARTYDAAMGGVRRNPRVQELNEQQPEFAKPVWEYLDGAVSQWRISKGQEMLAAYATTLAKLESRTGVPKEILTAIWGMESAYGAQMGGFNMFEALATLAYDGPRTTFARRELLAALRMMQEQGYTVSQMTSSWAGAFGHTQFVPSTFLTQAVDGDGDGKRDLWNSPADALASSARLLDEAGWKRGESWGFEIKLPASFAYDEAEIDIVKPAKEWRRLGVKTVYGQDLPNSGSDGSVFLPAGARGPAFLVFDNFKVVLRYNNATSYALAVCYLANRLKGGAEIAAAWPRDEIPLSRDQRMQFQTDLKKLGYDPGDIDGVLGRRVRAALRQYQKAHNLPADGFATRDLLMRMDAEVKAKGL